MSQLYGGRITDSQLTILCGLIDLLESGDEVLADKGFPEVNYLHLQFYLMALMCSSFLQSYTYQVL